MAKTKPNSRKEASEMYPLIELYQESNMTQKQFCEEMDILPHRFTYWLTKYRKENQSNSTAGQQTEFISLDISSKEQSKLSSRLIRVKYPDGTLVEFTL